MPASTEPIIPLAADFPSLGEDEWRALVLKSTHGRSSRDLGSASDDGIAIGPLYGPDASGEVVARGGPGAWEIVQRIDLPDISVALRQIEEDVDGGATAVELVFASSPAARGTGLPPGLAHDLDRLAALLRQNAVAVRVDAGEETPAISAHLMQRIATGAGNAAPPRFTAAFDPFATMARQGGLSHKTEEIAAAIAGLFDEFDRTGASGSAAVADGRLWHDGGASEAQELAAAIAAYVGALRLLGDHGIDPARASARIGLVLAADADQFLTIAKFRAARLLVARVLETTGLTGPTQLHAETAWRMLSRHDAHTNIVRTTTAALAAGLGGADSVTVLPFDSATRLPDPFTRRVARNSQTILVREASLAAVADPGAGAGAVEALTDGLAERAWDGFRSLEAGGGLLTALRAGTIQRAVISMRERRMHRVATRALPITGVTTFPQIATTSERAPTRIPAAAGPALVEAVEPLFAARLAEPFEALRERADRLAVAGKRPAIFLATLGRPREFAALVTEVRQLFASGGIDALAGPTLASADAASAAFIQSGAAAACICAGPNVEEALIVSVATALKAGGAGPVGLAGRPDGMPLSQLDFSVERDLNVVELLRNVLERIAARLEESP